MLRFRLLSVKIVSYDLLRLRVRLFFLDHSSTFAGSSSSRNEIEVLKLWVQDVCMLLTTEIRRLAW